MQKTTDQRRRYRHNIALVLRETLLCIFVISIVSFTLSTSVLKSKEVSENLPCDGDIKYMYSYLEKQFQDPNALLSTRDILKLCLEDQDFWLVWLSEHFSAGRGIIGFYDQDLKLQKTLRTKTISSVRIKEVKENKTLLLIREYTASGTGLYESTMNIINASNLKKLWEGVIKERVLGPVEIGYTGYYFDKIVFFKDVNGDKQEELVVFETKFYIPIEGYKKRKEPEVSCDIYNYDDSSSKYILNKQLSLDCVYPENI